MKKILIILLLLLTGINIGCVDFEDGEEIVEGYSVLFEKEIATYEITIIKEKSCDSVLVDTKINKNFLELYVDIKEGNCAKENTKEIVKGTIDVNEGIRDSKIYYKNKLLFN
jgi:hypothetical protein